MKLASPKADFLGVGDASAAYVSLRVALGLDMLFHGMARFVAGVPKFRDGMVRDFQATILPAWTVHAFASGLPFVELAIGVLLAIGLATRWVLVVGVALMCALMFGTALEAKWEIVTQQLFYATLFSALLATARWNRFAIDCVGFGSRSNARRGLGTRAPGGM